MGLGIPEILILAVLVLPLLAGLFVLIYWLVGGFKKDGDP
jgi:hypothetical protein